MTFKYPVYRPCLAGNEKKYVNECLDSTWISSKGRFVDEFPKKFAAFLGVKNATGVCNGTVALHLALTALGLGPGDEVIVPTFTYIASVNPITQVGARPVFVDSLPETWQMSPKDFEKKINPRTKAVMVVHLYGHPCDMDSIMETARRHDLIVIEDCAEAIGSLYKGRPAGSFGDIAAFSFFGNKTITCGEGGLVATNSDYLADKVVSLKGQGLARHREYWHDVLGFNYRMTNIQAALGLAQLERAEELIAAKINIAQWYQESIRALGLPVVFHGQKGEVRHSFWMNSILARTREEREGIRGHLAAEGIETRPTFYPVHTMPIYSSKYQALPVAEDIALRGINLPSYPDLTVNDVKYICKKISEVYE